MGFLRQGYWSGYPILSEGDLPNREIKTVSPALKAVSLLSEPPGNEYVRVNYKLDEFLFMSNVGI